MVVVSLREFQGDRKAGVPGCSERGRPGAAELEFGFEAGPRFWDPISSLRQGGLCLNNVGALGVTSCGISGFVSRY